MTSVRPHFISIHLEGPDAAKFLQGQLTINVDLVKQDSLFHATAICDLKGRVQFGLWIKANHAESFELVTTTSCAPQLREHLKKYSVFSKLTISDDQKAYPYLQDNLTQFMPDPTDAKDWEYTALPLGEYWIVAQTMDQFQPQELRLHQRQGVAYDKGCYIGQEVVARLYFKAKPKRWLHLVQSANKELPQPGSNLGNDIQVVNSLPNHEGWLGLVVASPTSLSLNSDLTVIDLPPALNGEVGR